jgi:hypothetical protein
VAEDVVAFPAVGFAAQVIDGVIGMACGLAAISATCRAARRPPGRSGPLRPPLRRPRGGARRRPLRPAAPLPGSATVPAGTTVAAGAAAFQARTGRAATAVPIAVPVAWTAAVRSRGMAGYVARWLSEALRLGLPLALALAAMHCCGGTRPSARGAPTRARPAARASSAACGTGRARAAPPPVPTTPTHPGPGRGPTWPRRTRCRRRRSPSTSSPCRGAAGSPPRRSGPGRRPTTSPAACWPSPGRPSATRSGARPGRAGGTRRWSTSPASACPAPASRPRSPP